jgi:hypothetical protein
VEVSSGRIERPAGQMWRDVANTRRGGLGIFRSDETVKLRSTTPRPGQTRLIESIAYRHVPDRLTAETSDAKYCRADLLGAESLFPGCCLFYQNNKDASRLEDAQHHQA